MPLAPLDFQLLGFSAFGLSQLLVGIAFVFDLLSFQFKQRRQILICFICSCTMIGLHFVLLGQWTAAALTAIAALRFTVSYFSLWRFWMYFFAVATCLASYLTYQQPINLLALLSTLLANYACFEREDERLRVLMMVSTAMWITHNVVIQSPAAVIVDSFFLASNFVGYYRYYVRARRIQAHDPVTTEEITPA